MKTSSIFKKTAVFSMVMLLVVLMAFSIVPFTASAAEEENEPVYSNVIKEGEGITTLGDKLSAMNVSQSGSIKMLFYYTELDENGFDADDYITITVPRQGSLSDMVTKVFKDDLKYDYKGKTKRYIVEVKVAAAQQTDLVRLQWVKVDGETETAGWIREYSVKYYANQVLNYAKNGTDAEKELYGPLENSVTSMLNYGAMAQTMFNHNTDKLANAGLFDDISNPIDNMTADNLYDATQNVVEKDEGSTVDFKMADAFLQDGVQLRIYFTAPAGAKAYIKKSGEYVMDGENKSEFKIWSDPDTGYQYVNVNNIAAHNFDVEYTIEIVANGKSASRAYSVLEYALSVVNNYRSTEEQKNTAKALYLYYAWMKNYATATDDVAGTYVPGPKDSDGRLDCDHSRSHVEADKVICSDCGYDSIATKLGIAVSTDKVIRVGENTDITVSVSLSGDVNLTALVISLQCDNNLTLTYKTGSAKATVDGVTVTVNKNIVFDGDAITANGTIATITYTVNAQAAGTYKITPIINSAANAESDFDISDQIATSYATVEVSQALCESCAAGNYSGYDSTETQHRAYCDNCKNVFPAEDHNYGYSEVIANGKLTYNSEICDVCNRKSANNVGDTYDLGFSVAKDENDNYKDVKTENVAPIIIQTPYELSKGSCRDVDGLKISENGAYLTVTNKIGTGDGYLYVYDALNVDIEAGTEPVTGQYMAIKYRTHAAPTKVSATQFYAGANNGATQAVGASDVFNLSNDNNMYITDGEWHVIIFDLSGTVAGDDNGNKGFTADDDGKYRAHYVRWDLFNNALKESSSVDIAYVLMSDDLMSLASFDGNDVYRFSGRASGKIGSYMGSTKTLNPIFDGYWLTYVNHSGGNTVNLGIDEENGNISFADVDRKGTSSDCYINLISSTTHKAYTTTSDTKYMAVLYRTSKPSGRDGWALSNASGASDAGGQFTASKDELNLNNQWHFKIYDLAGSYKKGQYTNYFNSKENMSYLRWDYYNSEDKFEGDVIDIAFVAVFDTPAQAYEYLGEMFADKLGENCQHDASQKSTKDCCSYCVYCGAKTAEAKHTVASGSKYTVLSEVGPNGELYEGVACADCGASIKRKVTFVPGIDSLRIDDKIANKSTANPLQSAGLGNITNVNTTINASDIFIDVDTGEPLVVSKNFKIYGWLGVNSGINNIAFRINDGEWQTIGKGGDQTSGGIYNAIIGNLPNTSDSGLGAGFQGGLTVPAKALQAYANKTVTFTFGVIPNGNTKSAIPFLTIKNMFIKCDHSTNTSAFTLDANDPQHLSTGCTTCGERITKGATLTIGGGTAFIGGSNLNVTSSGTKEKLTETYGDKSPISFTRIHSYATKIHKTVNGEKQYDADGNPIMVFSEERATIYSSSTRLTTKRYIAMMWRSTLNSSPELALDTSTGVKRNVLVLEDGGTSSTAPIGEWHFGIKKYGDHASYSMDGTDSIAAGAGNVTLDYINGSVERTKDDYVDVAFIAFFDSIEEAWAYYNLYAAAYLDEEECQHFARSEDYTYTADESKDGTIYRNCACGKLVDESFCQHYDFKKLSNVTAVENDGVIDYTADCGICGAKNVEIDINVPGGTQFFNPGRLQNIISSDSSSKKYSLDFPVLKDESGIPYVHVTDTYGEENYVILNRGGEGNNMTNVGDYFAVMYKTTSTGAKFQLYLNKPGTTNETGAKSPSMSLTANGNWGLAVFDFTTWSELGSEAGFIRFDFIDFSSYAKGKSVDIAWAGFFNTRDEANAYFAAYLGKYNVANHTCAHAYNWKQGANMFTYTKVCYVCGKTIGEAQTGTTVYGTKAWSAADIKALGYGNHSESVKTLTLMSDSTYNNMPFVRVECTNDRTGGESFIHLNQTGSGRIYNAGKIVAIIYRNSSSSNGINANEMFARYDDSLPTAVNGKGCSVGSKNYAQSSATMTATKWSLAYFDYSGRDTYDAWNGLGCMRWDIFNNHAIKKGAYMDIAAVATFNTVAEAKEFFDKYANAFGFTQNRFCFDSVSVGSEQIATSVHRSNGSATYDVAGMDISTATTAVKVGGWLCTPGGSSGYYYRVIDESGVKHDPVFIKKGTDQGPGTNINNEGKANSFDPQTCGIGAYFGSISVSVTSLKNYSGQTITVQFLSKTNYGGETILATFNNLKVPDCTHSNIVDSHKNYQHVVENDGNADGQLYEYVACPDCGELRTINLVNSSYTDYVYINFSGSSLGSIGNKGSADLAAATKATPATTVHIAGWCSVNGGVKAYYYRVNGGEWIKVGAGSCSPGSISNSGGVYDANKNDFRDFTTGIMYNAGTGINTDDLTTKYAGQIIKIEFGACPIENPGTEEHPNVFAFVTINNVKVAEAAE